MVPTLPTLRGDEPAREWTTLELESGARAVGIRVRCAGWHAAVDEVRQLASEAPDGFYPWRAELQKSRKGSSVTVTAVCLRAGSPLPAPGERLLPRRPRA